MGLFGPPNVEKLESKRRVKALIKVLDYRQSEDVRVAAAIALGVIKDLRAVDPLIATLENADHSWMLRQEAALSLGHLGGVRAVSSLIDTLNGEDSNLRFCAACALGEIGDSKALEPLVSSLEDNSGPVRSAVAEALDELGWKPETEDQEISYRIANEDWDECVGIGRPAVVRLIEILKHDHSLHVADAAKALGEIGDASAVVPLVNALGSDYASDRHAIVESLRQFGDVRALSPLIDALKDEDYDVRESAIAALVQIGRPAVDTLARELENENELVRKGAAWALGEIGDDRAVKPLINLLKDDWYFDEYVPVRALGQIGDRRAVAPLLAKLSSTLSEFSYLSIAIVEALGRIGDDRAVRRLCDLLEDADMDLRIRKVIPRALAQIGDVRAVAALVPLLRYNKCEFLREPDVEAPWDWRWEGPWEFRREVAEALDELGWQPDRDETGATYWLIKGEWIKCIEIGEPALNALVDALLDVSDLTREKAAEALDDMGWRPDESETGAAYWMAKRKWNECIDIGAPAIAPLRKALLNRCWYALDRRQVASTLGDIALEMNGDVRALHPLQAVLEDQELDVRHTAARSLIMVYESGDPDVETLMKIAELRSLINKKYSVDLYGDYDRY